METFDIRNVSFTYPEQPKAALSEITLSVSQGEFLVVCGASGSGKSTLLRQLDPTITPRGQKTGEILFEGCPLSALPSRERVAKIGFVQQSPDNQIVTDKVWHELAFGLESLGMDTPSIRRRVAEMAAFFGIEDWFYRAVSTLSGGQKQLLNLASVMVMQPRALILDEPTAQLDPIAAADFLATLGKVNRELGVTVILSEHRLEEALPLASKVAVMESGRLLCAGTVSEVGGRLRASHHEMFAAMPAAMRLWAATEDESEPPITVRDGRRFFDRFAKTHPLFALPAAPAPQTDGETVLRAEAVFFKYEKDAADVLRGFSLNVKKGEILALLGGNGTGKSTALKVLSGLKKPYRGKVSAVGSIGLLPQDPKALFVGKTVREDLAEMCDDEERLSRVVSLCKLSSLLERHPYDLSGGEQQRAALAKVLLCSPDVLLLDEPTKGFDPALKAVLGAILQRLRQSGVTILMVSHDVEFCARYAQRCAFFFDGRILASDTPRRFFSGSTFYTTSANRIARHLVPEAVTAEELIAVCTGVYDEQREPFARPLEEQTSDKRAACDASQHEETARKPLAVWRRVLAGLCGAVALLALLIAVGVFPMEDLPGGEALLSHGWDASLGGWVVMAALFLLTLCVSRYSPPKKPKKSEKLNKRTIAAAVMVLLLIPVTLFVGVRFVDQRQYLLISCLILFECMMPFFLIFEGRHPQGRELVLIASLCALGIVGRMALFMLPQFKPVAALVVIVGAAFGGETAFLVGALVMLGSNFFFGQSIMTPWQMFGMGLVGFVAGVVFRKGLLPRTRWALCAVGACMTVLVYGGVVNTASALLFQPDGTLSIPVLLTYYAAGLPLDCLHAASTAFFLWVMGQPMLEKTERIKKKYGILS